MWSADKKPDGNLNNMVVLPEDVLFEYDEPLIFRTTFGLMNALVSKVSERDGVGIYLACETNNRTVKALKEGSLSVFGAFDNPSLWLLAIDDAMSVQSYWNCSRSEVPSRFFAKPGVALYHWYGLVPDTIEQATALLALKFRGPMLTEDGMPLGKLRSIVEQASITVRKLLAPIELIKSKSSTFDVEVAPLKFASLVIAVKDPVFNMKAIHRTKSLQLKTRDEFQSDVEFRGMEFAKKVQEVHILTKNNGLDDNYARENFSILDVLADVLPNEDEGISSLEFNIRTNEGMRTVIFDSKDADKIKHRLNVIQFQSIAEIGVIDGVLNRSNTIRLISQRGTEVTCEFNEVQFKHLISDPLFNIGVMIQLTGQLKRRPRRDKMTVDSYSFI
ncbi:hypothetical protein [Pseudochrobactrum sp. AO18b]|uniref:hypothetical protein n=1 Tax=Pseudochrobactrum sp. AO18b TaxID=1201036 RepID=UPI0003A5F1B6|nr:hypothetical protein [Pseudochrobactrum sp. AO18b]MBX8812127.1 hypothetical protein [Ochrobactrum sp. MR34]